LFVAGVNPRQIRELWDSDPVLADDILSGSREPPLFAALGMNDEEIMSDFWAGQLGSRELYSIYIPVEGKAPI
jgi:hypothetical protein